MRTLDITLAVLPVTLFLPFSALSASADVPAADEDVAVAFSGVARNESDRVVYVEDHDFEYAEDRIVRSRTEYRRPNGETFASLESDYSVHEYLPAYRFLDERTGRLEGLRWEGEEIVVFRRERTGEPIKEQRFPLEENLVGGQGFNQFLIDNLDQLRAGETVSFRFLIPDRMKSYGFRIEAESGAEDDLLTLRCKLDNWLLRLLAPELDLQYDPAQGRLHSYRGNSNLADEAGEAQNVRIRYYYES